jgi:type I restriction enzyme, S subunit
MSEWQEVRLGDVLDKIVGGGTPSKENPSYWDGGDIFWCSVKDMSDDKFRILQTKDTITLDGLNNSSANLIPKGTVITATRMGLGRAFINETDMAINQDLKALIPNSNINNKYLLWTIILYRNYIEMLGNGATVKGIRLETLKNIKINLPPLPAQQKIAKILSNYDDLIENNLKRIKLLEESARLTYEDWLLRRKVHGEIVPDLEITDTPLVEMIDDYMNGGWGKEDPEGGYIHQAYVIRGTDMPDISQGEFSRAPLRFHTESNLKPRKLNIGDIAIEMSNGNIGNVGRSIYFDSGINSIFSEGCMCASFCKMIKPKSLGFSYLIDSHLKYIHNTDEMLIYKSQGANGINNFRFKDMVNDEVISIPNGRHLINLTEIFKNIYSEKSNLTIQIKLLKEARDILLPRLMTGMIDTDNMDIAV